MYYTYRNTIPSKGRYKDIKLTTITKAKIYVNWQYNMGLITEKEYQNALRTIEFEFKE